MSPRAVLTYREYAELPADGRRYEIHDGELSVTPAPSPRHQRLLGNLFDVLRQHVRAGRLGEILLAPLDVILSETTIVQPDIIYLAADRASAVSDRGIEGPPTLAIEILSPSTAAIDRVTKLHLYARYGVPFYWLVDPEGRSIEAFRLESARYSLAVRATGGAPVDLPPFSGLGVIPETLWP